jgi:hypothetical protein
MLVLVNKDRLGRLHEPAGISAHRRPRGRVVAVDHRAAETCGELSKERALPHRPRTVEDEHRLLCETSLSHIDKSSLCQAGQNLAHAPILAGIFPDSRRFFPRFRSIDSHFPAT